MNRAFGEVHDNFVNEFEIAWSKLQRVFDIFSHMKLKTFKNVVFLVIYQSALQKGVLDFFDPSL
jgi:hypothetical protein